MLKGLVACLSLVILVLAVTLPSTMGQWQESKKDLERKLSELDELKEKRDLLAKTVDELKTNIALQETALRQLGYVRKGETVYIVLDNREFQALKEGKPELPREILSGNISARVAEMR